MMQSNLEKDKQSFHLYITPQGTGNETSWVIRMCVRNIVPELLQATDAEGLTHSRRGLGSNESHQPLPVRLESLQLLATLCNKFFPLVR